MKSLKIYPIYFRILFSAAKRILKRNKVKRNTAAVGHEYSKKWAKWSTPNYLLEGNNEPRVSLFNGSPVICRQIDYRKKVLKKFADSINSLQPESVLEIGSGNGLNLFCLRIMCPTVKRWHGVELSDSGVEAAKKYLKEPPVESIAYVTKIPKEKILALLSGADISFEKGDMNNLPIKDREFDFTFSFHVLEQVPSTYKKVLMEVNRVTKRNAAFFEMFQDGQNFFQKIHIKNRSFFEGSFKDFEPLGFNVLKFERATLTQITFAGYMLLTEIRKD